MRFRIPWAGVAMVSALILMPMKAGGCSGHTACITFGKAKYDAAKSCPSTAEAMKRFNGPCGGGVIAAVNGEGVFDGEFCCYPVEEDDTFIGDCFGGFGGVGGTAGFGGVGGTAGFGGSPPPCESCSEALTDGVFEPLCSGNFETFFANLQSCGCSVCGSQCSQTFCSDLALDSTCGLCLQQSCPTEFTDCSNN